MHSMDWDDIRLFLAAHRAGSTAQAAQALGVQHTTVGRRLAGLEAALGAKLFIRTPKGLRPTEVATAILPLAEEAERQLQAIRRRIAGGDGVIEGKVRLTTSDAFSDFLVRHLPALHARHPALEVEVHSSNRMLDLARGEADIAVRMMAVGQSDLTCRRIGTAAWSLYAAESYLARQERPPSLADLTGQDVVGFDETLKSSPGAVWLATYAGGAHVAFRGNSIGAVMRAAVVGMGLAMLPCFMAAGEPSLRRIVPDLAVTRGIFVLFHPELGKAARIRAVVEFLAQMIREEAGLLDGTR